MTTLAKGTEVDAGDIVAPAASRGTAIVVDDLLGELAHGHRYRARQDNVPVLLTVLDPGWWADPGLRAALTRDLQIAKATTHRSLLPIHGVQLTSSGLIVVEGDEGGTTAREFAKHREARGLVFDAETVYTLVAHVCNGLTALHAQLVHGCVTADTVLVSATGRVFLSACGIGATLPFAPGFARFHRAGRLPNIAPEQLIAPPQLTAGTDVFGVATLFLELATGLPLREPGQPIEELGLRGPAELLLCLERATAPSPTARPPDAATFKAELAEALQAGPLERADPLAPAAGDVLPSGMPPHPASGMPPHPGGAAPWAGYPPPPGYVRGHPTPFPPPYPYGPPAYPGAPADAPARPVPMQAIPDRRPTPLEVELAELDRATRRINVLDEDDALALTSSVAAAVDPLALDVDEPIPPKGTTTSSSMLGLRLDAFDDAAARLSTLDGEHAEEARAAAAHGPSRSGTYFGSIFEATSARPEVAAAPREQSESSLADSDQRPTYWLVRRGERIGPLSLYELSKRAREGELDREDLLRHRSSGEELKAGDHDALRKAFRKRAEGQPFARGTPLRGLPLPAIERGAPRATDDSVTPRPSAPEWPAPRAQPRFELRSPSPEPARSFGTLWIVIAAVALLTIVGVVWMNA